MLITLKGLVVREGDFGDNDKLLHILTAEQGRLSVVAKGAKSIRNRYMTACQLFAYSTFTLYLGKQGAMCRLSDAELIQNFYELRCELETFALASYIVDASSAVSTESSGEGEVLKLALNTLYFLSRRSHPLYVMKGAFELRLMKASGFMPNLVACDECGVYESEEMYFDLIGGTLLCPSCFKDSQSTDAFPVSQSVLAALRFIIYSMDSKIFSFRLHDDQIRSFSAVCEKYMLAQIGHGFQTLDYYKAIERMADY